MELRVLRYFLAVAREGNITRAAHALHMTQPTLSRQIMDLEEELGQQLLIRSRHSLSLTPEGMLLRQRAEEILELVEKTEREVTQSGEVVSGDIYIGAAETVGLHFLTRAAYRLQQAFPEVRFHIASGDGMDVCEKLDKGLIDFGLLFDPFNQTRYYTLPLPYRDHWGVLMSKESPLARKKVIVPEDLLEQPLIVSRQSLESFSLSSWFGEKLSRLHIAGTYNLVFNGSLMVEDGMGYALCLDHIIHLSEDSPLCFRRLEPPLAVGMHIAWKKQRIFSKAAEKYLTMLKRLEAEGWSCLSME